MIATNRQQTCEFSLASGIWLQTHRVVTRDGNQHLFKLLDEMQVPLDFVIWRVRVHIGELGPGHWFHFSGAVEFHRARAKRNHGAIKSKIFVGETAQVTQHFMFGLT